MKNRVAPSSTAGSKAHGSDDEDDLDVQPELQDDSYKGKGGKKGGEVAQLSQEEIERRQLENAPVIGDSEISPAAYLFHN